MKLSFTPVTFRRMFYASMTAFLACLVILPFLAPVLSYFGYKKASDFIYEVFSYFCHQKAHRSMFILDEQCAWCVRDTFIWTTMFWVWTFVLIAKDYIPGIRAKTAFFLALPLMLDGGIQLIATIHSIFTKATPFYESTNLIRAITGVLFGLALGLLLFPRLKNELKNLG